MKLALPLPFALTLLTLPGPCQTVWLQVNPAQSPPPRSHAAMAFDYVRDRIVLWGGYGTNGNTLNDTWELDGSNWTERSPARRPPNTVGVMDFDRGRGRVVLVVPGSLGADTWEWDGSDWTQRSLAHNPPSLTKDLLVYDASRGLMVLVVQGNISAGGETWEYDGLDWTRRQLPSTPPRRIDAGMTFDPMRQRVLLHGGFLFGGFASTTWEYDGTQWTTASANAANPAHAEFAFAFDAARRRAVLFGGFSSTGGLGNPGTFEFTAPTWQLRTTVGPVQRAGAAMVYDNLRHECVLFGGRDVNNSVLYGDTFRYRALQPGIARTFGQGCAGAAAVPSLLPQPYHVPYVGAPFGVRLFSLPFQQPSFLVLGMSRTTFAGAPLPLSLGVVGMTGCQLFVSVDLTLPTVTNGSNATLTLNIPPQASLIGGWFWMQGFAVEVGGNAANLIATRALEARIGNP